MSAFLTDVLGVIRLADLVDILLLAGVLFIGIGWVRRSRSGSAARRMVALGFVFVVFYAVVDLFDLYLMERVLGVLLVGILVAVVVVFQADVRRLLDRIGAWSLSGRRNSVAPPSPVDVLTEAAARLAEGRVGALIAIRGSEPWESHLQGGIELDGKVSRPLLYSVFHPESPGHDGAVLVEGDRVTRFAAHLPLATHLPWASRYGGTRHAAGLGLTEECDALVIVVSEERGTISVAHQGELEQVESAAELGQRLERFWEAHYSKKAEGRSGWWSRRSFESALMSLALASSAWLLFSFSGDTVYRSYEIPVEFRNLPAEWSLQRDTALTALVTLAGSGQAFRRLEPTELAVSFDLADPEVGPNALTISADQLSLPSGLRLYDVSPRELTVGIERQVEMELPVRLVMVGELPDSLVLTVVPDSVTVLVRESREPPDHLSTEPIDPVLIPRSGTVTVDLVLPPGVRMGGRRNRRSSSSSARGPRLPRPESPPAVDPGRLRPRGARRAPPTKGSMDSRLGAAPSRRGGASRGGKRALRPASSSGRLARSARSTPSAPRPSPPMISHRGPHSSAVLCWALLLPLLASAASAQEVTIESLMGAPFPSEIVAAPSGGMVAWVLNDEGARNVWVADGPDYEGRPITAYRLDDGQEMTGLAISPDSRTLVFVRGKGANRQGENPNPASDPAGVEEALYRIATAGGEPVRIAPGAGAAISPRGDGVAFTHRGQVWWAPLDGSSEPVQLIRARGAAGSLRWSPTGDRLAFVSSRGDHSFVGVYHLAEKTVRWMAPSVDGDASPVWSPDGTRIAFLREPASSELTLFRPVREADPWGIWVADVASGNAREIWRADEGSGSAFYGIVAENQLFWGADDRIVFPWERTGWVLLYSVPAGGGGASLLTPGEFEVEYAALSADRRDVVYASSQDDIDRRHLWRVAVSGGPPSPITAGESIEWAPAPTADGLAVAYLRSGATVPAHAVVLMGDDERELAPGSIPGGFPSHRLVEPQRITLTAADGKPVPADLFLPADLRQGERRPAVIFIHGGSRRQMLLGFHPRAYYHNAYALNQYLVSEGYVVLSLNYRSGIGYGLDFREAPNYGATGASELYDLLGAGLYLRGRPDVDPGSIGLWGGSYGGFMTAMGLSRASDLFAAGVDLHGVHDWNVGIRTFVPSYSTVAVPDDSMRAFMASPMSTLDSWRSPVLVIHGDDDRNVAFAESVTLVEALRDRGVEVEQLVFPDEVHSFLRHESWLEAYRATADFLDRKLRGRGPENTAQGGREP